MAGVKNRWKEINAWTTIQSNMVHVCYLGHRDLLNQVNQNSDSYIYISHVYNIPLLNTTTMVLFNQATAKILSMELCYIVLDQQTKDLFKNQDNILISNYIYKLPLYHY